MNLLCVLSSLWFNGSCDAAIPFVALTNFLFLEKNLTAKSIAMRHIRAKCIIESQAKVWSTVEDKRQSQKDQMEWLNKYNVIWHWNWLNSSRVRKNLFLVSLIHQTESIRLNRLERPKNCSFYTYQSISCHQREFHCWNRLERPKIRSLYTYQSTSYHQREFHCWNRLERPKLRSLNTYNSIPYRIMWISAPFTPSLSSTSIMGPVKRT